MSDFLGRPRGRGAMAGEGLGGDVAGPGGVGESFLFGGRSPPYRVARFGRSSTFSGCFSDGVPAGLGRGAEDGVCGTFSTGAALLDIPVVALA